ncbi:CLUMA_CG018656, isoform A [Clunio marinus]|uniref:CLUMA_CG018656, isoform A n=1 Tax=Clunio marinus TaxID=568069 RepID=A0A1J1IZB1_9DIPT|nr:CLUMA_CG018656, isoform A [Clunio marinus]
MVHISDEEWKNINFCNKQTLERSTNEHTKAKNTLRTTPKITEFSNDFLNDFSHFAIEIN